MVLDWYCGRSTWKIIIIFKWTCSSSMEKIVLDKLERDVPKSTSRA
jgi:hypothetical protein